MSGSVVDLISSASLSPSTPSSKTAKTVGAGATHHGGLHAFGGEELALEDGEEEMFSEDGVSRGRWSF